MKKKIVLVPELDAVDFTPEVIDEMVLNDVSIHYVGGSFSFDWEDQTYFPETQKWLVEFYGEEIKEYNSFAVDPS